MGIVYRILRGKSMPSDTLSVDKIIITGNIIINVFKGYNAMKYLQGIKTNSIEESKENLLMAINGIDSKDRVEYRLLKNEWKQLLKKKNEMYHIIKE
jgi:hypothetical protein